VIHLASGEWFVVEVWSHERLQTTQTLVAARAIASDTLHRLAAREWHTDTVVALADAVIACKVRLASGGGDSAASSHGHWQSGLPSIAFHGRRRSASLLADPLAVHATASVPATVDSPAQSDIGDSLNDVLSLASSAPLSLSLDGDSPDVPRHYALHSVASSRYLSPDDMRLDTSEEERTYASAAAELALAQLVRGWSAPSTGSHSRQPVGGKTLVQLVYGPLLTQALPAGGLAPVSSQAVVAAPSTAPAESGGGGRRA